MGKEQKRVRKSDQIKGNAQKTNKKLQNSSSNKKNNKIKGKKLQNQPQTTKKNNKIDKKIENNQKNHNLVEIISNSFDDENRVNSSNFVINGEKISVFYVESLIDKQLLSSGLLAPLEKFVKNSIENVENSMKPEEKQSDNVEKDMNVNEQQSDNEKNNTNNDKKSPENSENNTENDENLSKITKNIKINVENYTKNAENSTYSDENSDKNIENGDNIVEKTAENVNNNDDIVEKLAEIIKKQIVSVSSVQEENKPDKVIEAILSGSAVIVLKTKALIYPLYNPEKRAIQEPPTSRVVKGPREGFVEDIDINTALIRKRLKTIDLKIVEFLVGRRTKTKVSMFYLKDIAKSETIKKLKKQIKEIDIDAIIDSYYIESFLETNKFKFFRRVGNTEKPDIFCAKILEGRVGLLVDGSPVALTVPFMLFEDLQSADDYYNIPALATLTRMLRIVGLIFALLIPGIYVSLQSYNYRILPINFLITLLSSIEGLSIPPLIEILIVLFLFEIIMEASLRMPNSLGMALSIIGALALGNTAVDAGIISPPSIVVVAVSSVALYIIPDQISQTRLLRLLFTAIGGIIGLYGIVTSFIILSTYLVSITSYGVPYMTPFAPSVKSDKKDAFIKHSIEDMKTRPELIADKNKTRQGGDKSVG